MYYSFISLLKGTEGNLVYKTESASDKYEIHSSFVVTGLHCWRSDLLTNLQTSEVAVVYHFKIHDGDSLIVVFSFCFHSIT